MHKVRVGWKLVLLAFITLGVIQELQGAPQTARWLNQTGVHHGQMLGMAIVGFLLLVALGLFAGPHRVKAWFDSSGPSISTHSLVGSSPQPYPTLNGLEIEEGTAVTISNPDPVSRVEPERFGTPEDQPIFDEAPPELAGMTAASLTRTVANRTSAQIDHLLGQHRGKPVRISGEVDRVEFGFTVPSVHLKTSPPVLLFFDAEDYDARPILLSLNKGDRIAVAGTIHKFEQGTFGEFTALLVAVDKCKLIDTPVESRDIARPRAAASVSPAEPVDPAQREERRIVVDVTPQDLTAFYEDHLAVTADKLAQVYIGKWMRVSGPVSQVSPFNGYFSMVTFPREPMAPNGTVIYMYFIDEWTGRLALLKRGTPITVLGKIDRVEPYHVHLKSCELDDAHA